MRYLTVIGYQRLPLMELLFLGVYRTDTASIEATGVGKANLLRQWGQLGREHGNWRCRIGGVESGMDELAV